jgi:hypothetical protein
MTNPGEENISKQGPPYTGKPPDTEPRRSDTAPLDEDDAARQQQSQTSSPASPDPVEEAERKLKEAQKAFDEAKKQKAADDEIKKTRDAIRTQRGLSQGPIADAKNAHDGWQPEIDECFTDGDGEDLKRKIGDAITSVADAERAVARLRAKVIDAERAQKRADADLAAKQKEREGKKAELGQLAARIKEAQAKVENLSAAVKSALDARNCRRAFGKNYQLDQEISAARKLLASPDDPTPDPEGAEKKILGRLDQLKAEIATAQAAADAARTTLETRQADLKTAEDELKKARANQEATIDSYLQRRWPNGAAQAVTA